MIFNENLFQVGGLLCVCGIAIYINRWAAINLFILAIAAVILAFIDTTLMGSKTILLCFLIYFFGKHHNSLDTLISKSGAGFYLFNHRFLFCLVLGLSILQVFLGDGDPGLLGTTRASAFTWDPNYFSILLLFFFFLYRCPFYYILFLVVLTQSLTCMLAIVAYRLLPAVNKIFFLIMIVMVVILPFLIDDIYFAINSEWLRDRIFSYNLRASWAHAWYAGDSLEGIAPHISFISGMKKNMPTTILFFSTLFIFSRNRPVLWMLLTLSLATDIFFGPMCFLVPIILSISDSSRRKSLNQLSRQYKRSY